MLKIKRLNSVGASHLLIPLVVIGIIASVGSYIIFKSSASINGTYDINKVSVQLGPEEYVAGPTNAMDAPYTTFKDNRGRWYGLTANSSSYVLPLEEKTMLPSNPIAHSNKDIPKHQVILEPDTTDHFVEDPKHPDACGAWMLSIQKDKKDDQHWYGWYHSEHNCLREKNTDMKGNTRTHMELAFAESFDAGNHWQKGNKEYAYPNNRILTADANKDPVTGVILKDNLDTDDNGGARFIRIGDYFYAFYQSSSVQDYERANGEVVKDAQGRPVVSKNRKLHLARSKVSEMGKPGSWWKWYCSNPNDRATCGYTEPGIGGKSTKLTNSNELVGVNPDGTQDKTWKSKYVLNDRYISYNRYLNRYIAFTNEDGGFRLLASEGDDFTNWKSKSDVTTVKPSSEDDFTVDNWSRSKSNPSLCPDSSVGSDGENIEQTGQQDDDAQNPAAKKAECKQQLGYNSIIGINGDSDHSGQTFYMYYVKHFPGQKTSDGYILRRKITFVANDATTRSTRTELSLYMDAKGNQRITSELPEPWLGYTRKSKIGYVLSAPAQGYEPLFECKKPNGTYYTLRLAGAHDYTMPVPADPPTKCNATDKLIRRVGWISPVKTAEATEAIFDVSSVDGKAKRGTPIGYGLPKLDKVSTE